MAEEEKATGEEIVGMDLSDFDHLEAMLEKACVDYLVFKDELVIKVFAQHHNLFFYFDEEGNLVAVQ